METIIIKTKTKLQAKTIKAVSDAMGSTYTSLEDLEDQALGKMMMEGKSELLTEKESELFFKQMREGSFRGL